MAIRPLPDVPLALGNLQDEVNRLFDRVFHGGLSTGPFDGQEYAPAMDVYELDDRYTVLVELPGVPADSVDVSFLGQTITIRGGKEMPQGIDKARRIRGERRFGTFCRSLSLPSEIEADRLSARCHAGILEIDVPKSEAGRPKSIKVDAKDD